MNKLSIISAITTTLGTSGALAVILGGGVCLGGLAAVGTVELGKFLAPNRPTYQKMIFYGSGAVGAGLFLTGAGVASAKFVGERMAEEESRQMDTRFQQSKAEIEKQRSRLSGCQGCKYWHGQLHEGNFLACAVHPEGKEDCPDWESDEE